MDPKFLKPYSPTDTEANIYKLWEESGFFNPDNMPSGDAEHYAIVMPPPNVTGVLHMGHALMLTLEDVMIRYKRMRGFKTLWIPGTDHAAIATQAKVEKEIQKKEGKSRHDLGREEMLKRIEAFAVESHDTIISQIKVIGASCDWSREAFTLDEKRNLAVKTMFKKMYDDGLIYRGNRIVNWDPKGQTTISDDEIVYEERQAKLYTFKYSKDFPISISTTRPETKVGDVAVAVHPDDPRYKKYIGQEYVVVFCDVPLHIKIIADKEVDPTFGTGALGVTPAHSNTDWEMADRHDLPRPQVINEYARMTVAGRLAEKKVLEARDFVVLWLKSEELLEKEKTITQNVSTAERTGGIVEPLPKLQWFINVNKPIKERGDRTLKDLMREPFEKEEIKIIPNYFSKTYFHWIENLRDWCISRQIWYGHRIPVWYKDDEVYVGTEEPSGTGWTQDSDTLDTWFSSGLWTFSTLGWPEKTKDLETFHPTSVLETGYEILFFWVARMVLMSEYALGEVPFKTVFLHGTVRDDKGQKMSKSLGNGIDPIDVAKKFGADAGRMALVVGTAPGTDSKISEDKIKGYKNFANKLWNIARFVLGQENKGELKDDLKEEFNLLTKSITEDLENYQLHIASEKIYHYIWHRLADEIIEESKNKEDYGATLYYLLENSLKLLHPFMPFVTEEIWSSFAKDSDGQACLLMIEKWPI
jgi:valyl-tRNA synthetase